MQMHGTSDLQGVLFGMRGDEVVTSAKLSLTARSRRRCSRLSQITITLNEQAVGTTASIRRGPISARSRCRSTRCSSPTATG